MTSSTKAMNCSASAARSSSIGMTDDMIAHSFNLVSALRVLGVP